jgi:hypothetical protein
VVNFVKGRNHLDERLMDLVVAVVTLAHVLGAVRQEFVKADLHLNELDFALPVEQGAA